jgi:hypothetical protein
MARPRKNLKLTDLQRKYVDEFMRCGIQRRAALVAGFSADSCDAIASELMKLPQVREEIARRKAKLSVKYEESLDRTIQEIMRVAFANIEDVMEWGEETIIIDPNEIENPPERSDSCLICGSRQIFFNPVRGMVTCLSCGWKAKKAPLMDGSGVDSEGKSDTKTDIRYPITIQQSVLRIKSSDAIPSHITAAISGISQTQHGIKIQMHSKDAALRMLGEYFGIFKDPLADAVTGLADKMAAADSRRKQAMTDQIREVAAQDDSELIASLGVDPAEARGADDPEGAQDANGGDQTQEGGYAPEYDE